MTIVWYGIGCPFFTSTMTNKSFFATSWITPCIFSVHTQTLGITLLISLFLGDRLRESIPFSLAWLPFLFRKRGDTHPIQYEVLGFIQDYRDTVSGLLKQQTMSWQVHFTGLAKDERTEKEMEQARHALYRNPPVHYQNVRQSIQIESRRGNLEPVDNTTVWDNEQDIPLYLQNLITYCSQNAVKTESFDEDCWGSLADLVWAPRCTTRLDSRYKCNGEAAGPAVTGKILLENHFRDDTINIAILGAGPAGLILANALSGISKSSSEKSKMRILVFENRLESIGVKQPYSRNWITDLRTEYFQGTIDPLLESLFEIIHWPGYYRIPIHATETLFLLSNRYRGVKFLYDDYQNYEKILSKIPNLVVFDATGHRMASLDREGATAHSAPTIQPWSWHPMDATKEHFEYDWYEKIVETGSLVHIAEQETVSGTVLFPVSKSGRPYRAHMLKINDMRMDKAMWEILDSMQENTLSGTSAFCTSLYSPCNKEQIGNEEDEVDSIQFLASMKQNKALNISGRSRKKDSEEGRKIGIWEQKNEEESEQEQSFQLGIEEEDKMYRWSESEDEESHGDQETTMDYHGEMNGREDEFYEIETEMDADHGSSVGYTYDQKTCSEWCGLLFVYDSPGLYREDINERMEEQGPEHLGQTLVLSSINSQQADALWYLLGGNMYRNPPQRLLENLPLSRLSGLEVFRPNRFDRVLKFLSDSDFWGQADVNLFQYRPYMYKDPVVPGGLFGNQRIPLLRIGDSLASGDPNVGTGLGFHIQVIHDFIERLTETVDADP